jgi:hypothetical protein
LFAPYFQQATFEIGLEILRAGIERSRAAQD